MRVLLIAHTQLAVDDGNAHNMHDAGWVNHVNDGRDFADWENDADILAEFAGRLCYQSWNRPNPATATNEGYLAHILEVEHHSVLEHASATFYVDGVSRSLTHELVRHRHLSYSQVSQRYVDESTAEGIIPPGFPPRMNHWVDRTMGRQRQIYETIVQDLVAEGHTRKQARQAARSVLPNATETKILVSGNLRAWRDVIAKRTKLDEHGRPYADLEIYALMCEVRRQLKEIAPNTFQDM